MNIRDAKIEDIPIIARLSGDLGYSNDQEIVHQRFLKIASDSNHAIFVAETDSGEVVGWLHVMPRILLLSRPLAEIGGVIVLKNYRRKGVGQRLMKHGESWAKKRNYEGLVVRSDTKRPESHYFYPQIGYELLKDQKVYIQFFELSRHSAE
jgi:N-acetylglutamate synthase-like GNAT family acetyltransferase